MFVMGFPVPIPCNTETPLYVTSSLHKVIHSQDSEPEVQIQQALLED